MGLGDMRRPTQGGPSPKNTFAAEATDAVIDARHAAQTSNKKKLPGHHYRDTNTFPRG